jgi:hypothetical protein
MKIEVTKNFNSEIRIVYLLINPRGFIKLNYIEWDFYVVSVY